MEENSSSLNLRKIKKKRKKVQLDTVNKRTYETGEVKEEISPRKKLILAIFSYFLDILVVLVIVIIIRIFIASPFSVRGHSMDDSFHDGDFIIVDQTAMYFSKPEMGDVIVFRPPSNKLVRQDGVLCWGKEFWAKISSKNVQDACLVPEYFIKRIIGLPGNTVKIQNGKVFVIDNKTDITTEIKEPYLNEKNKDLTCLSRSNSCTSQQDKDGKEYLVPAGEYFVLGDNRGGSSDSRYWTDSSFVPLANIRGRVKVVIWPISDFEWLKTPTY